MKNTSESPEGNEQAKITAARSGTRTSARSKSESATPGSQEQETRPTTRRRTAATSDSSRAAVGEDKPALQRAQNGTENAQDVDIVVGQGETKPSPQRSTPGGGAGLAPAPSRTTAVNRADEGKSSPLRVPTQKAKEQGEDKPAPLQTTRRPTPVQRSSGTGTPTQQPRQGEDKPAPLRPTQRTGGTTSPAQRSLFGPSPQQGGKPSGAINRAPTERGTPAQHPTQVGSQARPAATRAVSGNPSIGTARPGVANRPGATRTGVPGHPTTARPGTRPGTPAQRPQERRVVAVKEKPTGPVSIPPQIVVKDLAELLHATPNEAIRGLIKHGIFASINQVVEYEKAALVAQDLGFEPSLSVLTVVPAVQSDRGLSANEAMMASRHEDNMVVIPPVVTIMGHVDHGKTSLLDTIRKTKVAAGEAGGITQHIGAYQVEVQGKKITFLDTPGHEAFTAMRARGAQVTHIAIIVLAAEIQDIRADPNRLATGTIIEAKLEKNTGPTATALIQQGTLKMGDNIVVGAMSGKVRAMFNDRGKRIQKAPPSTPVSILGLPEVPQAGDRLEVVSDERTAKQTAAKMAEQRRNETMPLGQVSLDTLYMQEGKVKELNLVLKCDVQGSAEAIKNAISKTSAEN